MVIYPNWNLFILVNDMHGPKKQDTNTSTNKNDPGWQTTINCLWSYLCSSHQKLKDLLAIVQFLRVSPAILGSIISCSTPSTTSTVVSRNWEKVFVGKKTGNLSKTQRKAQPVFCLTFWVVVGYLESVTRQYKIYNVHRKLIFIFLAILVVTFFGMVSSRDPFQKKNLLVSIQRKESKGYGFFITWFRLGFKKSYQLDSWGNTSEISRRPFFFSKVMFFQETIWNWKNQQKSTKRPMMDVCQ